MLKKLSGWYRLFIIFAGVWTVATVVISILALDSHMSYMKERIETSRLEGVLELRNNSNGAEDFASLKKVYRSGSFKNSKKERQRLVGEGDWHTLAELLMSDDKEKHDFSEIESRYNRGISKYYAEMRSSIYLIFACWLIPIGLAYGGGWCVGWIINGFRKEK
tara:strand:- start:158 stop:646 length:489 start_codon:yes stop_codon:yes gene_type:complete